MSEMPRRGIRDGKAETSGRTMTRKFSLTHGAHYYNGKRTSRGQRFTSKLHKGIKSGDVEKAFENLEREEVGKNVLSASKQGKGHIT
jgi:hypothetical protein